MKNIIKLKVRDAENIVFEGEVDRISSFNEVGRFDVYPMHANFISIIRQELTLYNKHQKLKEIKIEQAILKIKQDVAHIFLGIDTLIVDEEKAVKSAETNE
jgi:F0F1-type ATP synthase epsilon subunit